jgi:hypothetical protein
MKRERIAFKQRHLRRIPSRLRNRNLLIFGRVILFQNPGSPSTYPRLKYTTTTGHASLFPLHAEKILRFEEEAKAKPVSRF